jgi:hypothetical protein
MLQFTEMLGVLADTLGILGAAFIAIQHFKKKLNNYHGSYFKKNIFSELRFS